MMRGRGGEWANMSVTGVPCVQTRERRRWDADSRMRYRHRRQTCTILYYHRSRFHFPPPKISEAPADRKKYVKKGIIVEDVDKCARRGCLSHVGLVLLRSCQWIESRVHTSGFGGRK